MVVGLVIAAVVIYYFARHNPSTTGSTSPSDEAGDDSLIEVHPNDDEGICKNSIIIP